MTTYKESIGTRNRIVDSWRDPAATGWWLDFMRDKERGRTTDRHLALPVDDVPEVAKRTLAPAPVYFVGEDALDVLAVAAKNFEPEPLLASDLPTPSGFMQLARPLFAYTGAVGEPVGVDYAPKDWRGLDMRGPLGVAWWPTRMRASGPDYDARIPSMDVMPTDDEPGDGILVSSYLFTNDGAWMLTSVIVIPFEDAFWVADDALALRSLMLPFQALMRLLQQEVFAATRMTSGSKKSKRASKNEPILVVSLPRRKSAAFNPNRPPSGVEWTHQWWVNPHWRNQWYPSLQTHRQKWIHGYVKGPDGLPFYTPEQRAFHTT
jgi:hypothetical protein